MPFIRRLYLFIAGLVSRNLPFVMNMRKAIMQSIGCSMRIIDIGCAIGDTLSSLGGSGRFLVGIDTDLFKMKVAKELHKDAHFFCMNAEELAFKDGSFDLSLFVFTIHELSDIEAISAIGEACRVSSQVLVADMTTPTGFGGLLFRVIEGSKLLVHISRDYDKIFGENGFRRISSLKSSENVLVSVYRRVA